MRQHHPTVSEFYISSTDNISLSFNKDLAGFRSELALNPVVYPVDLTSDGLGLNVLDLTSSTNKVIVDAAPGIYHLFFEILPLIITIASKHNSEVVFDIKVVKNLEDQKCFKDTIVGFVDYLNKILPNRITLIDSSEYDYYLIDNYLKIDRHITRVSMEEFNFALNALKEYLKIDSGVVPFRKVYLSRSKVNVRAFTKTEARKSLRFFDDQRLLDENIIEDFFISHGFEIICPEDFKSFEDQVNFFNEVKTLVSLSSSGIANSMFMQKHTNILELVTSFLVETFYNGYSDYKDWPVVEVLHGQYAPLAYILDQNYSRIPNYDRDPKQLIGRINCSKSILAYLEIENGDSV